jgi:ankyrin repeat protein
MSIANREVYLRACEIGDLKLIEREFRNLSSKIIERIKDSRDASCAHLAARFGHLNIIKYLILRKNISPHLKSKIGASILHDAAAAGQLSILKWLIHNTNLSIDIKDNSGSTVLHVASKFNHYDIVKWILDFDKSCACIRSLNGYTSLHNACLAGSHESAQILINQVPECVNFQSKDSHTPLSLAIENNHIKIVKLLLEANDIDLRLKSDDGLGILQLTCQKGHLDILKLIFECKKLIITENDLTELARIATQYGYLAILNEIECQEAKFKPSNDRRKTLIRASTQKSPPHSQEEAFQYSNTVYFPTDQIQLLKSPKSSSDDNSNLSESLSYEWPAPPDDHFQTTKDYQDTILFNSSNTNKNIVNLQNEEPKKKTSICKHFFSLPVNLFSIFNLFYFLNRLSNIRRIKFTIV